MPKYKTLRLVILPRDGDHRVSIARGATKVWLDSLATTEAAHDFAERVSTALGGVPIERDSVMSTVRAR